MLGIEYLLALIQVFVKIGFAIVVAIPFRIAWNGIAPIYLDFLPKLYLNIPYWHFVGILLVVSFVGELIQELTPKFVKVEQKTNEKS